MIPLSVTDVHPKSWQQQLSEAITRPEDLIHHLQIEKQLTPAMKEACQQFPVKVTQSYLDQIKKGDLSDPLLKQILPLDAEMQSQAGFVDDPVGDLQAIQAPGLIKKYAGRALLITTPACAIHCRYCFRRHYPYSAQSAHGNHLTQTLKALSQDKSIEEVILSGGDPMVLSDKNLAELITKLSDIKHLTTIRFHTRLPIVLPDRVTHLLLETLANTRLKTVMVVHCNHANEISPAVQRAMHKLAQYCDALLNQSVLLKGVNDKVTCLSELSKKLFSCGAMPYYLHQLDAVSGAAHFQVDNETARQLHHKLMSSLPGYLVPRLVQEIAGQASKTPL